MVPKYDGTLARIKWRGIDAVKLPGGRYTGSGAVVLAVHGFTEIKLVPGISFKMSI